MSSPTSVKTCDGWPVKATNPGLRPKKSCMPVRFMVVGLLCLGFFVCSMSRSVIATSIIAMAPQSRHQSKSLNTSIGNLTTTPKNISYCVNSINESMSDDKPFTKYEFNWTEAQQDNLRGAYQIGYGLALIPSGAISEQYNAKMVALVSGSLCAVLTTATPWIARSSYILFVAVRIVLGTASAMMIPAGYCLISRWVHDDEKSKSIAVFTMGNPLGNIVMSLASGYLCVHGWPLVYYLTGGLSFLWCILWWFVASSFPTENHLISEDELIYIEGKKSLKGVKRPPPITISMYIRITFAVPVLALLYVRLTHTWFYNFVQSKLPQYMVAVLGMSLEQVGIWNTFFHGIMAVMYVVFGSLSDIVSKKVDYSKTTVRKSFESVSLAGNFAFMLLLATSYCNRLLFILYMGLALTFRSVCTGGSLLVFADLTKGYTGTLVAIINCLCQLFGYLIPHLITSLENK